MKKLLLNIQKFAAVNYATVYEMALAQKFEVGLKFVDLYTPSVAATGDYKFTGGKTFLVPVLTVGGFIDADRDAAAAFARNVDNAWESHTMDHDREFSTLVDPMDIDETNEALAIANVTKVFNEEQKIPEMDAYMASKLYSELTTLGTIDETVPADAAAWLALFDSFMSDMDDVSVPEEGRILYLRAPIYTFFKNALGVVRQIGNTTSTDILSRNVQRLDDVKLVRIPTARMKTSYDFTTGFVPAVGAKDINMILVHPRTVIAPIKMDQALFETPTAHSKGKFLYYERMYLTAEVLEQRVGGLKINAIALA
jgi:hypothetical protein